MSLIVFLRSEDTGYCRLFTFRSLRFDQCFSSHLARTLFSLPLSASPCIFSFPERAHRLFGASIEVIGKWRLCTKGVLWYVMWVTLIRETLGPFGRGSYEGKWGAEVFYQQESQELTLGLGSSGYTKTRTFASFLDSFLMDWGNRRSRK